MKREAVTITDPKTGEKRRIIVETSESQTTRKEWDKQLKKQNDDLYTPDMIGYRMDFKGTVDDSVAWYLLEALSSLPRKVIDFIVEDYVLMAPGGEDLATHWGFNDCRFKNKKGFIIFHSNLWKKSKIKIAHSVAHEIAHAWNKDAIDDPKKTEMKYASKIEIGADKLATKWLSKYYKGKDLKKCCNYWGNKEFERRKKLRSYQKKQSKNKK